MTFPAFIQNMGKLIDLSERAAVLTRSHVEVILLESIKDNEEAATNLNTDQMWQGEDATGRNLPEYSERSVQVFGKPSGPMRLFDTGDFYRSIFINADKFPVVFSSKDSKEGKIADLLASKGTDIQDVYGLNKQNLKSFARGNVLETFQTKIRNVLHL